MQRTLSVLRPWRRRMHAHAISIPCAALSLWMLLALTGVLPVHMAAASNYASNASTSAHRESSADLPPGGNHRNKFLASGTAGTARAVYSTSSPSTPSSVSRQLLSGMNACEQALQGFYNVTFSIQTESGNGDLNSSGSNQSGYVITESSSFKVTAVARFAVSSCSLTEGANYTLNLTDIVACTDPDQRPAGAVGAAGTPNCTRRCSWAAAEQVLATFSQLPNGTFTPGSLQLQVLGYSSLRALLSHGCNLTESIEKDIAEVTDVFSQIALQVDTRFSTSTEVQPVLGSRLSDDGTEAPLPMQYECQNDVSLHGTGVLTEHSRYLVPTASTFDALDGSAVDVAAGQSTKQYFSSSGRLLVRYSVTNTELPLAMGAAVEQDTTGPIDGTINSRMRVRLQISVVFLRPASPSGSSGRRLSKENKEDLAFAMQLLQATASDGNSSTVDDMYPGGYDAYMAGLKEQLSAQYNDKRRLLRSIRADLSNHSNVVAGTRQLSAWGSCTPELKTLYSKYMGTSGSNNKANLGFSAKLEMGACLSSDGASGALQVAAGLSAKFFGVDLDVATYTLTASGAISIDGSGMSVSSVLRFPVIWYTPIDEQRTLYINSDCAVDGAWTGLGSKSATVLTVTIPVVVGLSVELSLSVDAEIKGALATCVRGCAPVLAAGGMLTGRLYGTGSIAAGVSGLSASVSATVDLARPSLTVAGAWGVQDLLAGRVALPCTNVIVDVDGLGVSIGWEMRLGWSFLSYTKSGTFWSSSSRNLFHASTSWTCDAAHASLNPSGERCQACTIPTLPDGVFRPDGMYRLFHGGYCGDRLPAGSTCYVSCGNPYMPFGYVQVSGSSSSSYTCSTYGKLDASQAPVCEKRCVDCRCRLPTLPAGLVAGGANPCSGDFLGPSSSCSLQCAEGYGQTSGSATTSYSCSTNGKLDISQAPVCSKLVACTLPSLPTGLVPGGPNPCSNILYIQYRSASSSCSLQCAEGYIQTSGSTSDTYSCSSNGQLDTSQAPVCEKRCVDCRCPLPTLPDGVVAGGANPCNSYFLSANSSCSLQCAKGYYERYGSTYTAYSCSSNGKLDTSQAPFCDQKCAIPRFPAGVTGGIPAFIPGAYSRIYIPGCDEGGYIQPNSDCSLACLPGYEMIGGNKYASCLFTTPPQLSLNMIVCASPCTLPSLPTGLKAEGSNPCGSTLPLGSSCSLQCASGYVQLSGNTTTSYTCSSNGQLDISNVPVCAGPCTLPSLPTGLIAGGSTPCGSTLPLGSSCSLQCATGYAQVSGTSSAAYTCSSIDKLDTSQAPVCAPTCSLPSLPDGVVTGGPNPCSTTLNPSSSCSVQCATGYVQLYGSNVSSYTCSSSGRLNSSQVPGCSQTCFMTSLPASLGLKPGGPNPCDLSLPRGASCTMQCASGSFDSQLASSKDTSISCASSGQLDLSQAPFCSEACILPSPPAGLVAGGLNPCSSVLLPSSSCSVQCASGYVQLSGSTTTSYTCSSSRQLDTSQAPVCSKICTLPSLPTGLMPGTSNPCSNILSANSSCSLQCAEGYVQTSGNTTTSYSCSSNGQLDTSQAPACTKICTLTSFPDGVTGGTSSNGAPSCRSGGYLVRDSACSLQCLPGYKEIGGNRFLHCSSTGQLSSSMLVCTSHCDLPSLPAGLVAGASNPCGSTLQIGSSCSLQCASGYNQLFGSTTTSYSCSSNGQLDISQAPVCSKACTLPSLPTGLMPGTSNPCSNTLSASSSCNLQCATGYVQLSGSTTISYTCSYNGQLDISQAPVCSKICTLPSLPTGVMPGTSNPCSNTLSANSSCSLQCAEGYLRISGSTSAAYSCSSNGKLDTSQAPACTKICTLPSFPDGVTGGAPNDGLSCRSGGYIVSNSTCSLSCLPGYEMIGGDSYLRCSSTGQLTSSMIVCAGPCTLPSLPTGLVAGGSNPCGGTLPLGSNCSLQCATGYAQLPGTSSTAYTCSSIGQLDTSNTPVCAPTCTLPSLPAGLMPGTSNPCSNILSASSSCSLQCASGYVQLSGSTTTSYTCSSSGQLDISQAPVCSKPVICTLPSLPTGLVAGTSNPCSNILSAGSSCSLQCASGYVQLSGSNATSYTCSSSGQLDTSQAPVCATAAAACTLPALLTGTAPGASSPCTSGSTLASGRSCGVQCASGFLLLSGSTSRSYTCSNGQLDSSQAPTCTHVVATASSPASSPAPEPTRPPSPSPAPPLLAVSCSIPAFVAGVVGGASSPCTAGTQTLAPGSSCNLACDMGYALTAGSTSSAYSCSTAGDLTANDPTCSTQRTALLSLVGASYESVVQNVTLRIALNISISDGITAYMRSTMGINVTVWVSAFTSGASYSINIEIQIVLPAPTSQAAPTSTASATSSVNALLKNLDTALPPASLPLAVQSISGRDITPNPPLPLSPVAASSPASPSPDSSPSSASSAAAAAEDVVKNLGLFVGIGVGIGLVAVIAGVAAAVIIMRKRAPGAVHPSPAAAGTASPGSDGQPPAGATREIPARRPGDAAAPSLDM